MAISKYARPINKATNGLGFLTVFSFMLNKAWTPILDNPVLKFSARIYLFPLIGLTDLVRLLLTWHDVHKNGYKSGLAKLALDAVTFAAVATAITIGFTIGAVFTTLAPIIFTSILSLNSLANLGFAAYDKKARGTHLINALTNGLAALAIGMILLAGQHLFAIAGLVGAAISTAEAVYQGYKLCKKESYQSVDFNAPKAVENQDASYILCCFNVKKKNGYAYSPLKENQDPEPETPHLESDNTHAHDFSNPNLPIYPGALSNRR